MTVTVDSLTEIWVTGTNATATYTGWQDISSKVMVRNDGGKLVIARGAASETSNRVSTSSLAGQLNNRAGNFSEHNPTGIYYGLIGRNTPIRTSRRYAYDAFGRTASNGWGTSDSGQAWSTNGGAAGDYSVSSGTGNISNGSTNVIRETILNPVSGSSLLDGTISATLKPGVVATGASIQMSLEMRRADASNYLAAILTFGTAGTVGITIAARVAGVTTVLGSNSSSLSYGATDTFRLEFHVTGGQYVARAWSTASPNTQISTYADDSTPAGSAITAAGSVACRSFLSAGNTNVSPTTKFDDLVVQDIRFSGEIPDLPQEWDNTGVDVWVPFTASGRLRRLQQGNKRIQSVMTRGTLAATPIEFWPCEDASGASEAANLIAGGMPMATEGGTAPTFGTAMAPGTASGFTLASDSQPAASVRAHTNTGYYSVQFMINMPSAPSGTSRLFQFHTSGSTYAFWAPTIYPAGGVDTWGIEVVDAGGVPQVTDTGTFSVNGVDEPYGRDLMCTIDLRQNGANVEFEYLFYDWTQAAAASGSGSYAGTMGSISRALVLRPPSPGAAASWKYSQITVWNKPSIFASWATADAHDIFDLVDGFVGEDPVARLMRLADENGLVLNTQNDSVTRGVGMGPQPIDTLYNLLNECADVDQGWLYESRVQLGLTYRAAESLYNQTAVALSYTSAQLSGKLATRTDDQLLRNDVTVARKGGSSARATDTTSRLSTSEPPTGVGTYDRGSTTVNCETDDTVPQLAGWLLALGTVDEPRYPGVQVELHRSEISTVLGQQVAGLDTGDYFTISSPPAWLPQFDIECLVLGSQETISRFTQTLVFTTRHGSPYRVLTVDGTGNAGRTDIDNATLNGAHTSTTTTLSIAYTGTVPLSTDAADYPFNINVGGEEITLNNAPAGSTSPQSLTGVTRSVNSVVKAQISGTAVALWRPYTVGY
jgi:hypothetical protein